MIALTRIQRIALTWLLSGNGQKYVSPYPIKSPYADEKHALRDAHRDLERMGLVRVGSPSYHGERLVHLTAEGRALVARPCGQACGVSTAIDDETLTFGRGELDTCGFWSVPCEVCAADHARRNLGARVWPAPSRTALQVSEGHKTTESPER